MECVLLERLGWVGLGRIVEGVRRTNSGGWERQGKDKITEGYLFCDKMRVQLGGRQCFKWRRMRGKGKLLRWVYRVE